ncbi:unnamed protein product [Amoebophrya sp. A25]|nr:unnamed protein product [Amoebophrya sp. A25]|eukprot:GSA25T00012137001.1
MSSSIELDRAKKRMPTLGDFALEKFLRNERHPISERSDLRIPQATDDWDVEVQLLGVVDRDAHGDEECTSRHREINQDEDVAGAEELLGAGGGIDYESLSRAVAAEIAALNEEAKAASTNGSRTSSKSREVFSANLNGATTPTSNKASSSSASSSRTSSKYGGASQHGTIHLHKPTISNGGSNMTSRTARATPRRQSKAQHANICGISRTRDQHVPKCYEPALSSRTTTPRRSSSKSDEQVDRIDARSGAVLSNDKNNSDKTKVSRDLVLCNQDERASVVRHQGELQQQTKQKSYKVVEEQETAAHSSTPRSSHRTKEGNFYKTTSSKVKSSRGANRAVPAASFQAKNRIMTNANALPCNFSENIHDLHRALADTKTKRTRMPVPLLTNYKVDAGAVPGPLIDRAGASHEDQAQHTNRKQQPAPSPPLDRPILLRKMTPMLVSTSPKRTSTSPSRKHRAQ